MSEPDKMFDLIVIGGGLAGLTAARCGAERGLTVASVDETGHMGGLVMNVGHLDGYPDKEGVSGIELAAAELEALVANAVEIVPDRATGIVAQGDRIIVSTDGGDYGARTLVLASGARLRTLGIPGEVELAGRGVSQCADCDASFFAGQDVVVIGGGDSALKEALHLADYAERITLVTRGDALRARSGYIARAEADPKFEFRLSTSVQAILGKDSVEGVRISTAGDGATEELACSGVFVFVGLEPNSGYLPDAIARDAAGCVITDETYCTSLPGVYAVGAIRAGYSGHLVDAVGEATAVVSTIAAASDGRSR